MRELFIYYRLRSIDSAAAQEAVRVYQAQLRQLYPSLLTRLLRRPEEADGQQTWMETYSTDPMREPTGVNAEMQSAIESRASGLLPWLSGPRHTEVFIACVS
jgi:hypothetical protein